jgi:hypothetical protein
MMEIPKLDYEAPRPGRSPVALICFYLWNIVLILTNIEFVFHTVAIIRHKKYDSEWVAMAGCSFFMLSMIVSIVYLGVGLIKIHAPPERNRSDGLAISLGLMIFSLVLNFLVWMVGLVFSLRN